MYWSRAAREAGAKLPGVMQDLGKARDTIMGCRRPATDAASSLAKLLRRPRCTLRGARMVVSTASSSAAPASRTQLGYVGQCRRKVLGTHAHFAAPYLH